MEPRSLRWPAASGVERCTQRVLAALSAWSLEWCGTDVGALVCATANDRAVQSALHTVMAAVLPDGRTATLGFAAAPASPASALLDASGHAAAGSVAAAVVHDCELDLARRLLAGVLGVPDSVLTAPAAWPVSTPVYSGGVCLRASFDHAQMFVYLCGATVAAAATLCERVKPAPITAALVRKLATRTSVQGRLKLAEAGLTLGSLLQVQIGDVLLLERSLDSALEWEIPELGLSVPAHLARCGDRIAVELVAD